MSRTRYTVNADGDLVSREGVVLGKVVGITIEAPKTGSVAEIFPPDPPSFFPSGKGTTAPVVPTLSLLPSPAEEVWATYVAVIKPRRTDLTPDDRQTIGTALKVATVAQCQRAIAGCAASDWHMGRDPQTAGKSYKQLSQILKGKRGGRTTREQIEFFADIADAGGVGSEGVESIDRTKLSRHKAAVITAWEYPADDRAAAAGDVAREWLKANGVIVDPPRSPLDPPTFRMAS